MSTSKEEVIGRLLDIADKMRGRGLLERVQPQDVEQFLRSDRRVLVLTPASSNGPGPMAISALITLKQFGVCLRCTDRYWHLDISSSREQQEVLWLSILSLTRPKLGAKCHFHFSRHASCIQFETDGGPQTVLFCNQENYALKCSGIRFASACVKPWLGGSKAREKAILKAQVRLRMSPAPGIEPQLIVAS